MQYGKKLLCLCLVMTMMLGMVPVTAIATGNDQVYISVSYDGTYINTCSGDPLVYMPVSFEDLAAIDLDSYGLGEYLYDEDGDGTAEITALHMVIYAHENLYGGDWSDVTFTGAPGSSYFEGGIFGFDENLNYFLNGEYPLAGAGWGATSDQIVLKPGDFLDIASFSSWDFFGDSNYGFHFFVDENEDLTHDYVAQAGTEQQVKLVRSYSGMGSGAAIYEEAGYQVSYGLAYGEAEGTVTTDDGGCASIVFPEAGTWHVWCDGGYGSEYPDAIVSAPAYAVVSVSAAEGTQPDNSEGKNVSEVLFATMEQMAQTVTEPVFGTTAGEWTVFSLARGNYYAKNHTYFADYYDRIVDTVNQKAAAVNLGGALHKHKSTENSRLIVTLSALGKDATSVGDWNLISAYDDFSWIKKQGINGAIWALLALDSHDYETTDSTIRQQCLDAILDAQHDDGGWSLTANLTYASDPDITGMALQALYPYRGQATVAQACLEGFACLSEMQHENGAFASGGSECAESCAWVIVACTTWGIDPHTDSRFIKNGSSVVDALLNHYVEEEAMFQHVIGAGSNAIATDQACYALVAYHRLQTGRPNLFDMRDVVFGNTDSSDTPTEPDGPDAPTEPSEPTDPSVPSTAAMTATLGLPAEINPEDKFYGVISVDQWDNEAGYKLIDFIVTVPANVGVLDVRVDRRLSGGEVSYHLDPATNKLRVVYFDANENSDLIVSGEEFPAELFAIGLQADGVGVGGRLNVAMTGMSVKLGASSEENGSMIVVNTEEAAGTVSVVAGVSFSAVSLYQGDDVDLISSGHRAVAVAVTKTEEGSSLTFRNGEEEIPFRYSRQITEKTGICTFVALVDASIEMEKFVDKENFVLTEKAGQTVTFGDTNADGVVNAQDALAAVDTWLRKCAEPEDVQILTMNVNGDSRINTFDALGIVEAFVNSTQYGVVTKAASITTNS